MSNSSYFILKTNTKGRPSKDIFGNMSYFYNPSGAGVCNYSNTHINQAANYANQAQGYKSGSKAVLRQKLIELQTALGTLEETNSNLAQYLARMTEHMMQTLKNIHEKDRKGVEEEKKLKHIKKEVKALCRCYKKSAWTMSSESNDSLKTAYAWHPVMKAVGIAIAGITAAVLGFAAAACLTFIDPSVQIVGSVSSFLSSHILAKAPIDIATTCLDITAGKAAAAGVFGIGGLAAGFPLTKFFEKRLIPGNVMNIMEDVTDAAKNTVKKSLNEESDAINTIPASGVLGCDT